MSDNMEGMACPVNSNNKKTGKNSFSDISRKDFLQQSLYAMIGVTLAITGGFNAATILRYLTPPSVDIDGRTKLGWLEVGTVKDFDEFPKKVDYGDEPVYIYLRNKKLVAFSAACPHVRCLVVWNVENKPVTDVSKTKFNCPCHTASFDIDGKKLSGPAPRGMFEQKIKTQGNKVLLGGGTPSS